MSYFIQGRAQPKAVKASSTGLYYYGYRYYDPETGRWLNRDPIEESEECKLYALSTNDEIERLDYLGR